MSNREYFQFLAYRWDVTRAQEIAADLPVYRMAVEPWFGWLPAVRIDEDYIDRVDLGRPLIMVKIKEADGALLIIDGWHRIARAQRDSVSHLPVTVLNEEQEREVRIFGGSKKPRSRSGQRSSAARRPRVTGAQGPRRAAPPTRRGRRRGKR
ncbi:hypothetical protein [Streptomyces millisiae]|uniref:ParB/Sulfiredoxin domain-containing protein n=1 Tax=Streptomyces millisiae TaxID=3075542 RepID=A0ABU2LLS1_9ACTN|nr:hypothetical protein [Streptomyces sp. DSM 44918]MDT0318532.1 hypothetical protein [Streptomyces sp. DSM 44918]